MRREISALIVLLTAAWALLLAALLVIAVAIVPISEAGPTYYRVSVEVGKAVSATVIVLAWIYSYVRLRDLIASYLLRPPRPSSSDRTPRGSRGA